MNVKSYTASASRGRENESIYVKVEIEGGGWAHFYLTRNQAYQFSALLRVEADWLTALKPQPKEVK